MAKKRKTMSLDDDSGSETEARNSSEDEDLFKRPKTKHSIPNLADGPQDFIDSLVSCGFYPKDKNEPNQLSKLPSIFREKLSEHFGPNSLTRTRNAQFFVDECKAFFVDMRNFVKALQLTCSEQVDDAFVVPQDSLVRILLNMPELQAKMLELLLEKLEAYANGNLAKIPGVNLPSLILGQMSWLGNISQGSSAVVDKLLEILAIAPLELKREIISHFPGIATDSDQIRVAFALCEILQESPSLTAAVLEALRDVHLPSIEATELRTQVIKRIGSVPLETLPILITFVLRKIGTDEASNLIRSLRDSLDSPLRNIKPGPSQRKASNTDCLSLCIENLYLSFRYKIVADVWLKLLRSSETFCPLDVLVLILLHKVAGRNKMVESLFKNKVRAEVINDDLVSETFKIYAKALDNFYENISDIANSLYSSKDPVVVPCGSHIFKELFVSVDCYHQQEVVRNLIRRVSMGDNVIANAALHTLQDLAETSWSELVRFSSFIVSLLEYLDKRNLPQIRSIMQLLARLAYGSNREGDEGRYSSFTSSVQSELNMVLRKQLTHARPEYQRMGVVGSIAIIQILADAETISDVSPADLDATATSYTSTQAFNDSSVQGRVKLARKLLKLARACATRNPSMTGLFYDELASTVLRADLSPQLQLFATITEDFQDNFIVDFKEDDVIENSIVPLSVQYGLDDVDENSIALNLAPLVMQEMSKKTNDPNVSKKPSLISLFSHFRLVYQSAAEDLEQINALLGCHIWLPAPETIDKFEDLSQNEKDFVCLCLVHTLNWFVELMNAFAREKNSDTRVKVCRRLRNFIEVREKLMKCLVHNPLFVFPRPIFDGETQAKGFATVPASKPGFSKAGKGRGRGKKSLDTTAQSLSISNSTVLHSTPNNSQRAEPNFTLTQAKDAEPLKLGSLRPYLREIDLTVFTLLTASLPLGNNELSQASAEVKPEELQFLLEDLVCKMEHSLVSAKRQFPGHSASADKGSFAMLDLFQPHIVARRCVILVKRICKHLEDISGYFQTLIGNNDGILDAPGMFTELSPVLGTCYALSLRVLSCLLSWHEFHKAEYKTILVDALKHLAGRIQPGIEDTTTETLVPTAFRYVSSFASSLPFFSCAVEQIAALQALLGVYKNPEMSEKLGEHSLEYLKREWSSAEGVLDRGTKFNQGFEVVLKAYLMHGGNVFKKIETLASTAMQDVLKAPSKDGASPDYPTFCKSSFSVFFRVLLSSLIASTKTSSMDDVAPPQMLKMWSISVSNLNQLISAAKVDKKQAVLSPCLKYGRLYLDLFLRQAIPLLEKLFKSHSSDCQQLLKNLQSSTRTLQQICTETKCSRNATLSSYIPALKKSMEAFIYRVKGMLAVNGCADAFWLGNLKNKNLQGEEVLSQSSIAEDSGEEESERDEGEDENEEEDDDDVTVLGEDDSDTRRGGRPASISAAY